MPLNLDLQGVWDDSTGGVRCDPCRRPQTLKFPKRADVRVNLIVKNVAGEVLDLTADPTIAITLTARRQAIGADVIFPPRLAVLGVQPSTGIAYVDLASDDTSTVEPGRYAFDVWMEKGGEKQPLTELGALFLEPESFQGRGDFPPGLPLVITPPMLAATVNDYAPVNWLPAKYARLAPAAGGSALTGLRSAGLRDPGKALINLGPDALTLVHESVLSVAENRFHLIGGLDIVVSPFQLVTVFDDDVLKRWLVSA